METFVSKDKKLTGTDTRGVNHPHPRILMENPSSYALFFVITISMITNVLEQNMLIITLDLVKKPSLVSLNLNFMREQRQKKKKLRERSKKKGGNDSNDDDDDEFDDSYDSIYKNSEGNIVPSFKTNRDGSRNTLIDDSYDLNNFWKTNEVQESRLEIPDENHIDEPDRKEVDVTVSKYFDNIESIVNEEKPEEINYDDDDDFNDKNWSRFVGGYNDINYLRLLNEIERRGLAAPVNVEFIDYLRTPVLQSNRGK